MWSNSTFPHSSQPLITAVLFGLALEHTAYTAFLLLHLVHFIEYISLSSIRFCLPWQYFLLCGWVTLCVCHVFFAHPFLVLCVYVVHAGTRVKDRGQHRCLSCSLHLICWDRVSHWTGVHGLAEQPGSEPPGSPVSASHTVGSQACAVTPSFLRDVGGLNSGLCAYTEALYSTSTASPSFISLETESPYVTLADLDLT